TSRANRSTTSQESSWGGHGPTTGASCVFELRADHMGSSLRVGAGGTCPYLLLFGRHAVLDHPGRVHKVAKLLAVPDRVQILVLGREFLKPRAPTIQGQAQQAALECFAQQRNAA